MDLTTLLLVLGALAVGTAAGYLAALARGARAHTDASNELSTLRAQLEAARTAGVANLVSFEDRLAQAKAEGQEQVRRAHEEAGARLADAEQRHADSLERLRSDGDDRLAEVRTEAQARLAEVRADHKRMADEFDALSRKALEENAKAFLAQAEERLKRTEVTSAAELAKREAAVKALVEPLTQTLAAVETKMTQAEKDRLQAHTSLTEQVKGMQSASDLLRSETNQLVTALRAPQVRGAWGEMQLRRTVEAAGMVEHVHFEEQVQVEGGKLRPDLLVSLPDGKQVVVDAKVAFNGYLEAMEARDDSTRAKRLQAHARHMRTHIDQLSGKEYWSHLDSAPEFTVMFVPSEVFLNAALEQDPGLMEHAFARDVVMATPATLVTLLRTVAYTWRQEHLATEARQVFTVGRELHKRLSVFGGHLKTVSTRLNSTVESFNKMTASLDSRVVPQVRKFSALQGLEAGLEVPPPLEVLATPAQKDDLYPALPSGSDSAQGADHEKALAARSTRSARSNAEREPSGDREKQAEAERDLVIGHEVGSRDEDALFADLAEGGDEETRADQAQTA